MYIAYFILTMLSTNIISVITTAIGLGFMSQLNFLWIIPCILLKICGVSSYYIKNDRERIKNLLKIFKEEMYSTSSIFEYGKLRPGGTFIGRWCYGYYIENQSIETGTEIFIVASEKRFKELIDRSAPESVKLSLENHTMLPSTNEKYVNKSEVNIWNRKGGYTSFYYRPFTIELSNIYAIGDQSHIIKDIVFRYKQKKRLTVFIHGITGSGKSTVGLLLAKELKGSYCHDFNPTDPGDLFSSLLNDIEFKRREEDDSGPIVIVLEEVNIMIDCITNGTVHKHKNVCTSVHNKMTFNSFLDDMVFHKNIILILTSNVSKRDIDKIDSSYLRQGRINAYYSMMKPIETT